MIRADLHLHSRHSRRSAEWLLRRFDFPDSVSDPKALYRKLRDAGMSFVTFTDHNEIGGCLEIAGEPGVFLSEEVTAHFPGDRREVHILVWDITEEQHLEIADLRRDVRELAAWLNQNDIAHAVAHPLLPLEGAMDPAYLGKLLLLFRHFEGVNGLRDDLFNRTFRHLAENLTPEKMAELADRNDMAPLGLEPWKKILVGGSDDHGGIFPGSAWTEVRQARNPQEFLACVRRGECVPGGRGGTPLALSHSLYNTVYFFLKERFFKKQGPATSLVEKAFSRFMEGNDPTQFTFSDKMGFVAEGILSGKIFDLVKPGNASLWKELADSLGQPSWKNLLRQETDGVAEPERRAFLIANATANRLAFRFFERCLRELSSGNPIESLQSISAMIPVLAVLSPYLYAFQSQAPDRRALRTLCLDILGRCPAELENNKRAWATDTLDDVNGVSTTIRRMAAAGARDGVALTVLTCSSHSEEHGITVKNFTPIGEFSLPEYELQKLSFPPVLAILDYIQREGFTEVIVSTPGPMGLASLLAAKMLGLETSGIYHTDFPQYVRILTEDGFLETLTWNFMHWFYSQLDLVYVNSAHYRHCWTARGIPESKLHLLPRGLDLALFRADRRDTKFWTARGLRPGEVGVLYVGRVSREKNLEDLAGAFRRLGKQKSPARLLVVGDGPFHADLGGLVPDAIFTGTLSGEELATAYASADLFAFPSTTDTFGNVILEAMASGLPCIVSDVGGPSELVTNGVNGRIVPAGDCKKLADAIGALAGDAAMRTRMSREAIQAVADRDWQGAFRKFWARPQTAGRPSQ